MTQKLKYTKPKLCILDSKPAKMSCMDGSGASGTIYDAGSMCASGTNAENMELPGTCASGTSPESGCSGGGAPTGGVGGACANGNENAISTLSYTSTECTTGTSIAPFTLLTGTCSTGFGPQD